MPFDFQLYGFVIPTLIALWQISNTEAGTLATITLLSSGFGGWFAGVLAGRFGRDALRRSQSDGSLRRRFYSWTA
jgi:MFS family permease